MKTTAGRNTAATLTQVLVASGPVELFGVVPPADDTTGWAQAQHTYRLLARTLHPDVCADPRADQAFARLSDLWNAFKAPASTPITITTRKHSYTLAGVAYRGDIANLYAATSTTTTVPVVVKMPRSVRSNDLLEAEAKALNQLKRDGDPTYAAYVPTLIETFRHRDDATGVDRRVNVLERLDGFVNLADVGRAYPNGVDPRDAAWMWRRLLVALGYAHRAQVVHGAVLPEHILIHPAQHGLVLTDWCYATTEPVQAIPAIVPAHKDLYPAEVLAKKPATSSTDLYLAAGTMAQLIGPALPASMAAFVARCIATVPTARPTDAWVLLAEFDALLEREYGPRTFRVFTMPSP